MSGRLSAAEANRCFYADVAESYDRNEVCASSPLERARLRAALVRALDLVGSRPLALDAYGGTGNASELLLELGVTPVVVDATHAAGLPVRLAGTYELLAVSDDGGTGGGVDGTEVPNHVYRWTRREVRKTVRTFDPARTVPVEYEAHWFIGPDRVLTPRVRALVGQRDTPVRGSRALAALALNRALNGLARRQGNIFGFVIRKDLARLQPWIAASPHGSSRSIGSS